MVRSANLGFPRIGAQRELKRALEAHWSGDLSEEELQKHGKKLRAKHWRLQEEAGVDVIPSGDFSFYDQVLDTACMVGAVPERFNWDGDRVGLETYFAMARGIQEKDVDAGDSSGGAAALEMTKWFDTNYHYLVPELSSDLDFSLSTTALVDQFEEAREMGITTRPVLLGPVSFVLLSKTTEDDTDPLDFLPQLLPVYEDLLDRLDEAGATSVQIDEPFLGLDLSDPAKTAYRTAYETLGASSDLDLVVATYFEGLRDNLSLAFDLPIDGLHLDLVRAPEQLEDALSSVPNDLTLSFGLVDGRNVWRTDLDAALVVLKQAVNRLGEDRVQVAPSCSLLHVPVDLETEDNLPDEVRPWLAFARQKLDEVVALAEAASGNADAVDDLFAETREALSSRRTSTLTSDESVRSRMESITDDALERDHEHSVRRTAQQEHLGLPVLPTTTIGSFPQTQKIRDARARFKSGEIERDEYESFLEDEIDRTLQKQEDIGLDVLVHGEPERSDMVEYFGEQLDGFLFTENGWVQSYGSRCVRPPVIYGDVSRPEPMTVRWSTYAQSQTDQPVKGMLTGPVTMLQWSFVRDDQPRSETCRQIALALRDEVEDLEEAGISVIQIDEPALREGMPLRDEDGDAYLQWAVDAFRLASAVASDRTQIHTHMCYSEFGGIIASIARMDADVISIESSRSKMELLDAFEAFDYPNQIGPGVYDIHSPRVPPEDEMEDLLHRALHVLNPEQLWVNPDCGLKTRRWQEVEPSLRNMVDAAERVRESLLEEA